MKPHHRKRQSSSTERAIRKLITSAKRATAHANPSAITLSVDGRSLLRIADDHEAYVVVGASYPEALDLAAKYVSDSLANGVKPQLLIRIDRDPTA